MIGLQLCSSCIHIFRNQNYEGAIQFFKHRCTSRKVLNYSHHVISHCASAFPIDQAQHSIRSWCFGVPMRRRHVISPNYMVQGTRGHSAIGVMLDVKIFFKSSGMVGQDEVNRVWKCSTKAYPILLESENQLHVGSLRKSVDFYLRLMIIIRWKKQVLRLELVNQVSLDFASKVFSPVLVAPEVLQQQLLQLIDLPSWARVFMTCLTSLLGF